MRRTAILAILSMVTAMMVVAGPLSAAPNGFRAFDRGERASGNVSDAFQRHSPDDIVQVFIQLDEPAVAELAATGAPAAAQKAQGQRNLAQQARIRDALSDVIVEELSSMQVAANGLRVKVRAGDIPAIRAMDGVLSVSGVTRYYVDNEDSVPWIGGDVAKAAGADGDGVSIAVIDTGVDYTHAAFGGPGTEQAYDENETGVIEPGTFPTAKVVGGFDFAGPIYDPCASTPVEVPSPDPDPLDVFGHGTHVAATAAGLEVPGGHGEGMAPDAVIYAYKVFGDATGCTDLTSDAIERALDPNNDLATDDHVDIINMSLGSDFGLPNDPSTIASQNAVDLGVVVVAASGNAGDIPYITSSPANADGAISVAASIDDGFFVNAVRVNSPAGIAGEYEATIGDFGALDSEITDDIAVADPLNACDPTDEAGLTGMINNPAELEDNIALIQRGTCSFSAKVRAAQEAGAIAVVVFDNQDEPLFTMSQDGTPDQPTIPAMLIGLDDGEAILAATETDTVNVTMSPDVVIEHPELADEMAAFSSRGPGIGNVFKPDVSAPGFGIISADVGSGDGGASSNGTSMATPHIAGLAAQLLDQYPDLTPEGVKSLIMNSARPAEPEGGVALARQGTGVAQADVAVLELHGYASPAGVSFGRINPLDAGDASETVTITRLEDDTTYTLEFIPNQPIDGVDLDFPTSVTTSGGTAAFDVTLSWDPEQMPADVGAFWEQTQTEFDGWIRIFDESHPGDDMVVGVMAVMDPASDLSVSGGQGSIDVANGGADGLASGYNLLGVGDASNGTIQAAGFTTFADGDLDVLDIALGLEPTETLNPYEIDVFLDADSDGSDDFLIVAADFGLLTGTGEFSGLYVTALFDLNLGGAFLQYVVQTDYNDEVASLLVDLNGDFGMNSDSDEFTADIFMFDLRDDSLVGLMEDLEIDLGSVIETEIGNLIGVGAGDGGSLSVTGSGDMLWLFPTNQVGSQYATTTVEAVPAPEPGPVFDDVPEDHLFFTEISWLAEEGITRGCNPPDNTLFCPDGVVTRGQMAAFIVRALGLPASSTDHFDDDDGHLFEAEINALADAGITRGCNPPDNTHYCPDATLTRAEMATFMQRAFELDPSATDWFVDDDGNIHEDAINAIAEVGITRGCNPPANTNYCPNANITRGQMAAFLYRAFHLDS
ncbi:MAG TPA: S8 family serine peptidase [Acidimicrobiia bacterium]